MPTYFAYGSNMDRKQMAQRCPGAALLGRAVLPGYALRFAGQSGSRGNAGVATIRRAPSTLVPGALWALTDDDLRTLDAYEGHPRFYRRVRVTAEDFHGRIQPAWTYALPDDIDENLPTPGYARLILDAYYALGLVKGAPAGGAPAAPAPGTPDATGGRKAAPGAVKIFVYGTLMRGEPNHRLIHGRFVRRARTAPRFTLVSMGGFPALLRSGRTAVAGEIFEIPPDNLKDLDRLEGHPDFYRRERIELENRHVIPAYVLPPRHAIGRHEIRSGDWRNR